MNLKSVFGGVSIGRDTSGNIKPSLKGLAVKVAEDKFVVKDGDQLVDVDGFVIDQGDKYVYRIPVKFEDVAPGDLLITSENPFQALFVVRVHKNRLEALDPRTSTILNYIPPGNVLGVRFFVKAVSLLEGLGGGSAANVLPLLALTEGGLTGATGGGAGGAAGAETEDGLVTLLLLQGLGTGQPIDANKLLYLRLMRGMKDDGLTTLLFLQASGMNMAGFGSLYGQGLASGIGAKQI